MGWSGDAMLLGKLPVPGRPTNLENRRARPTALAVGAEGGSLLCHFHLHVPFSGRRPDMD